MKRKINHILFVIAFIGSLFASYEGNAQRVQRPYNQPTDSMKKTTRSSPIGTGSLFKNLTVAAPDMADMKKNIVYPVDYSTGTPDIKIPLLEIKSGSLTLPIYLTYHASGVKLEEVSGWVGQGWQLVAEPMISRDIKGLADELGCSFDKNAHLNTWEQYRLTIGAADEQPDEFYYRLADKQGMFMYVLESEIPSVNFMSLPFENIRIKQVGKYFEITDDDGTLYKFNGGTDRSGTTLQTVGWRASAMIAPNRRDSISFLYNSKVTDYHTKLNTDYIIVVDAFDHRQTAATYRFDQNIVKDGILPDELMQTPIVYCMTNGILRSYQRNDHGKLVPDWNGTYDYEPTNEILTWSNLLKEITFAVGKVEFITNNSKRRLENIRLYDKKGNIIKNIELKYQEVISRYYLSGIVISDKNKTRFEKYDFTYYNPIQLPAPGNRSMDYWGYYNGVKRPDTETLVPYQTIETVKDSLSGMSKEYLHTTINLDIGTRLSRDANPDYTVYGSLKSITYPTGGKDEFVYEGHMGLNPEDNKVRIVGGLRIKQIKTYNKENVVRIRSFTYGRNEDGIGYTPLSGNLEYYMLNQMKYYGDPLYLYNEGGVYYWANEKSYRTARYRTFFSSPKVSNTFNGGTSVMYDYVTEYNGTIENNSGKTVYIYNIDQHWKYPDINTNLQRKEYIEWKFGHLNSKVIYNQHNGIYKPVESVDYVYDTSKNYGKIYVGEAMQNDVYRMSEAGLAPPIQPWNNCSYTQTVSNIGPKLLTNEKHTVYDDKERTFIKNIKYDYGIPYQVNCTRKTETTANDSDKRLTDYTYPSEYGTLAPYADMVKRNMVNSVVKTTYMYGNKFLEVETPYFTPYTSVFKPAMMNVRYSKAGSQITRYKYLYDEYGNPRQEIKDGNTAITYLYGYNHQYMIAKIENATYQEVVAFLGTSFINSLSRKECPTDTDWKQLQNLRTSLKNSHITTYTYIPLTGISSITDPSGTIMCYEYDGLGRLNRTYIIHGTHREILKGYEYHYTSENK